MFSHSYLARKALCRCLLVDISSSYTSVTTEHCAVLLLQLAGSYKDGCVAQTLHPTVYTLHCGTGVPQRILGKPSGESSLRGKSTYDPFIVVSVNSSLLHTFLHHYCSSHT